MTFEDFLNVSDDEVWINATLPNGKDEITVWSSDWLGGHDETLKEVEPYLDLEVDDMRIEKLINPESKKNKVEMICVNLYK